MRDDMRAAPLKTAEATKGDGAHGRPARSAIRV
jgi:hypothetical protein